MLSVPKFPRDKFILGAISRYNPDVNIDFKWLQIAPSSSILWDHKSGAITTEQYTERYLKQLEDYGFDNVKSRINKLLSTNKNVVLLCYESPEKFCHRHIFAEWYNTHLGDKSITEYLT